MAVSPSSSSAVVSPSNKKQKKRKKNQNDVEKDNEKIRNNNNINKNDKKKKNNTNENSGVVKSKRKAETSAPTSPPKRRAKSPGVRLVGGRIYDSENGKTCHQCRQKTMDFVASCKNQKNSKACTIKFCYKCLFNRYGEKAEEMERLGNWTCPKCRGICNCSFCMKRRGHQPTGILVHTAKATGFSSVSEMLQVQGPEHVSSSPRKELPSCKAVASPRKVGKEGSFTEKYDLNLQTEHSKSVIICKKTKGINKKTLGHNSADTGSQGRNDDNEPQDKKRPEKFCISSEIPPNTTVKQEEQIDKLTGAVQKRGVKTVQGSNKIHPNAIKRKRREITKRDSSCLKEKMDITEKNFVELTKKEEKLDKKDGSSPVCHKHSESVENKSKVIRCLHKQLKNPLRIRNKENDLDIPLPEGIDLKTIAGIEFPATDVGHALQFLEFCKAFEEILDLKQGMPESVLQELMHGCGRRRGQYSSVIQFHNRLLCLIQEDKGERSPLNSTSNGYSWLHELRKFISESNDALKELPLDCFDADGEGYKKLETSKKLRLLNFLCDEALCTENLRGWIDEQNSRLRERKRAAKEKVLEAKEKERRLKQKMRNKIAKAILAKHGAPLSISEHEQLVSKIKDEEAKARAEKLEAVDMLWKDRLDAVRTQPLLFDGKGHAFWRLGGYSVKPNILCQDIGSGYMVTTEEKWFTYDVEQKQDVENYISCLRGKRLKLQVVRDAVAS